MVKVFDIDIPCGYAGHVRSPLRHIDIGDGEFEWSQAEVQDLTRLFIQLGKNALAKLTEVAHEYNGGYPVACIGMTKTPQFRNCLEFSRGKMK